MPGSGRRGDTVRAAGAMTPRLELRGITKTFPGVVANDGVSLAVMPGEIHAVLGENGAGKSTLMKIVYGATAADRGEIFWDGEPVRIPSPAAARQLGIGMVYQHFSLFESVSVAENIAVAVDEPFDLPALSARVRELSQRYGLPLDPGRLLGHLSVGERQRVEIVRCLLQHPRLLILDEPTSVLTPQAVKRLFETLRVIAAEGCSLLYISHKLEEIRALCDNATVLRRGAVAGGADPKVASSAELAALMTGAALPETRRAPARPEPAPRIEVRGLNATPEDPFGVPLRDVSFAVHPGEIVGVAGVSGNGQTELAALLSGERTVPDTGRHSSRRASPWRISTPVPGATGAWPSCRKTVSGAAWSLSCRLRENSILTAHRLGMVRRGMLRRPEADGLRARGDRPLQRALHGHRPRPPAPCRAATSRSTSWGARSPCLPGCSWSRSRPGVSTSPPPLRFARP